MNIKNAISIQIPAENLQTVQESLADIEAAILPFLLARAQSNGEPFPK